MTHWITAHDPDQGHIEIIKAHPLCPHEQHETLISIFGVTSVPVTKDLLKEGIMERPAFGDYPSSVDDLVKVIFADVPPQKTTDPIIFHRTLTLDVVVCIYGEVVYFLPSGEKKILKAGDSVVQRGTTHALANFTDQPARVLCTVIKAREDAIEVNGEHLGNYFDLEGKIKAAV